MSAEIVAHVRALRHIAGWPYSKIAVTVGLSLGTVYRTAQENKNNEKSVRGRPWMLRPEL